MATGVAVGMKQNLPGGNSAVVPPDPMPNSEVKRRSADGSVGSPHARVGHCQASIKPRGHPQGWPFCYAQKKKGAARLGLVFLVVKSLFQQHR